MPDQDGLLTENERRKLALWTTKHPCPACGSNQMTADECLRAIPPAPNAMDQGLFLCVALVCQCGNSVFLHAPTVGIL